jgi:hypothetical protein
MHKYLRNRAFSAKHWNRIRSKSHPYHTITSMYRGWSYEDQIKSNFESIEERARTLESGSHRSFYHAPSAFRRVLTQRRRAKEKNVLAKIRNGNYEAEMPKFRRDADWNYF